MQLQQRMQLVQKMQQQGMMGNPIMAQQQPPQQQGMIGNPVMAQHQPPQQQGMMGNPVMAQQQLGMMVNPVMAQHQQGMMGNPVMAQQQSPQQQGMMGNPVMAQQHQGMMGNPVMAQQQSPQQQGMMGNPVMAQQQQGMMGNPAVAQQHPPHQQGMMGYQGPVQTLQGPPGNQAITQLQQNPTGQQPVLTPQQQAALARHMLLSKQQHALLNPTSQQLQPAGEQSPVAPPLGPTETTHGGPQLQGGPQVQGGSESLSQAAGRMQHLAPPGMQQLPHVLTAQQQQSQSYPCSQQAGGMVPQGQAPMGAETVVVKQEGQQGCYVAQQQAAVVTGHVQGPVGQNRPDQPQQNAMAHPNQQEQQLALLAQQQKQSMMGQRPGAPVGQIRVPVNLQAFVAQNPQLRHLTPNQQIQHIQALIAQRQQMQGQLLRAPPAQAQAQGQGQAQQMQVFGPQQQQLQQLYRAPAGHQVALGPPSQQHGVMRQTSGGMPQMQQSIMGTQPQQQQLSMMGQAPGQHQLAQPLQPGLSAQQQQGARSPMGLVQARGQVCGTPQCSMFTPALPRHAGDASSAQQQHPLLTHPMGIRQPQLQQVPPHHPGVPPRTPFQAPPTPAGSDGSQVGSGSCEMSLLPPVRKLETDSTPGLITPSAHATSPVSIAGSAGLFSHVAGTVMSSSGDASQGLDQSDPPYSGSQQPASRGATPAMPSPRPWESPCQRGPGGEVLHSIKQEPREVQCDSEARTGAFKREANGEPVMRRPPGSFGVAAGPTSLAGGPQAQRTETGQQLLQKLLRAKNLQAAAAAQRPTDSTLSEINGHIDSKLAMLEQKLQGTPRNMEDLQAVAKKAPAAKAKAPPNCRKKPKKEDAGNTEVLMKQLKQELALLPLMEPRITANLEAFAPFGSSPANGKARLKGSFGSAVLDDVPDYYSQLLTKNHLSNPPTPPSSLPPTPPPSVHHKLLNGVTAAEELLPESQKKAEAPEEGTGSAAKEAKNVDLLAALPTPPHNQNEDVRMESDEDSDAPDSVVLASSPESVLEDDTPRFPRLGERRPGDSDRAGSPVIPIIPRVTIPVFPKTEPFLARSPFPEHAGKVASDSSHGDGAKSGEVSVTVTIATAAAKNLNGVMSAVAGLLRVETPSSYEVAFVQSPGRGADGERSTTPGAPATPVGVCVKSDPAEMDSTEEKADWTQQCGVALPGCSLKKQMDILSVVHADALEQQDRPIQHRYMNNDLDLDVRRLPVIPVEESPPESPPIKAEPEPDPAPSPQADPAKPRSRSLSDDDDEEARPDPKKWKGLRWKRLQPAVDPDGGGFAPRREEGGGEVSDLLDHLRITLRPDRPPRDLRSCSFCHEEGDAPTDGAGRLLNVDVDLWAHLNCALWSTEVYETQGGALVNVEAALRRGLRARCTACRKPGATGGCAGPRCLGTYHFACAVRAQCAFFKDKTMLCPQHRPKGASEEELGSFAVFRRVYVERDELKQIAGVLRRGDRLHTFRVGGMIFHAPGQLLPSQMAAFHSPTAIFPVGYEATRIYWSTRTPNRRCRYRCRVAEAEGCPLFQVRVLEQGQEDLLLCDSTPEGIWGRIVEQVAALRRDASMLKLFTEHVKAEEMFGLTTHAVLRITESLPGVENCQNYAFRYGRHPLMELPLMINPTGCARSEPKILTHYKRPHTLTSTSMAKAYQSTITGEVPTPYSKQFVHSKSSQYRRLRTEWKTNVYLARSRIQGLGLYAAKDLEMHTMVIEYIGATIRNEVANRREKVYEEQNRGIYMFRVNNEHVIDATLTGGLARYVNHSCAPNCVTEVVTCDREDKIIIISSRRIPKGEELTYDYQFDFEDDQHKIPCHCGAWNCRKWMN
ncbi:hypothetical protein AAFF_G00343130 [Aldrovandia affinis]|uniref:[histone H3]-lysine(4) N-methyltransferase n=1 Tax=Aldrovandia affinis TaxID=143900 RepID=A0AAD7WP88_9TELE|nr:hypothetical protein AAFF_G00343130 [Aldrovandia affinis]